MNFPPVYLSLFRVNGLSGIKKKQRSAGINWLLRKIVQIWQHIEDINIYFGEFAEAHWFSNIRCIHCCYFPKNMLVYNLIPIFKSDQPSTCQLKFFVENLCYPWDMFKASAKVYQLNNIFYSPSYFLVFTFGQIKQLKFCRLSLDFFLARYVTFWSCQNIYWLTNAFFI